MSRKHRRGRPARQYRLRVRTVRREPIDSEALARAALEHAAMNEPNNTKTSSMQQHLSQPSQSNTNAKDPRHDRLA